MNNNTQEEYFGLKIAYNFFDISGIYQQNVNQLWDIFEAAEYPVIYIQTENEVEYCLQKGEISNERLQKEGKPIIVLINNKKLFDIAISKNISCLYSLVNAKIGKDTRKVTRYIIENETLGKIFEVQPELVKAITREKIIQNVIKD
jgi:hypothetical protein